MEEGQICLIKELNQGKELARLLCNHIASSTSHETNGFLIDKILSSYEKALNLLTSSQNVEPNNHGSPKFEEDNPRDVGKKRKIIMPRWTEHVKVCSRSGIEGSLDDGYSWRKYGQKDILGAKFPRGYYRCTHRFLHGCQATKQVQRSDEDPTTFEVTYRGKHTCNKQTVSSSKKRNLGFGENYNTHHHQHQSNDDEEEEEEEEKLEQSLVTFFNFEPELEVKMDDIFPTSDNYYTNQFMGNFSGDFISPSSSESSLFGLSSSPSPCHMGSGGAFGQQNVHSSESEMTDMVSVTTSVTDSPLLDLDALFDKQDFQSDFLFNTF